MAKERADKPRKEKAEKAEKKVSQDKVKKHKKDKKPKVENDAETSSVDINLGEDYVALAEAVSNSISHAHEQCNPNVLTNNSHLVGRVSCDRIQAPVQGQEGEATKGEETEEG